MSLRECRGLQAKFDEYCYNLDWQLEKLNDQRDEVMEQLRLVNALWAMGKRNHVRVELPHPTVSDEPELAKVNAVVADIKRSLFMAEDYEI